MHLTRQHPDNANRLFALAALLMCMPLLTSSAIMAGEVSQVTAINFGAIDLNPGGDTIVIDARSGAASPRGSRSVITGGGSGLIRVTSTDVEHVEILYPDVVLLACGSHTLRLTEIGPNSQYHLTGVDLPGGGVIRTISVGGSLDLQGNEASRSCSGSMSIQLNFF